MRLWLLGALVGSVGAAALAQPAEPNLIRIATRYIAAQEAVMEKDAGPRDVDALISFYASDYIYYHPQFGAKVTGLDAVRQGITSHFGETRDVQIEIKGTLISGDMV